MKILFWNCRGVLRREVKRHCKFLVKAFSLNILVLLKTHTQEAGMNKFLKTMEMEFEGAGIPGSGHSGGIIVCWNKLFDQISWCKGTEQVAYLIIQEPRGNPWILVGVYANPDGKQRRYVWSETTEVLKEGLPTLLGGDFNTLLGQEDRRGGAPFRMTSDVLAFRQWVNENHLQTIEQKGQTFTLCNNRHGSARTWEAIDRAFVTHSWMVEYPSAIAQVLLRRASDHSPIILNSDIQPPVGRKPFRFERIWFEYPDLPNVVEKG
ncbi:hypothetical protein QJS10_CPB20g00857 [Acorus calamus]|uniref:Endonuclease/exonuclease/phosphatase domain-containing protein n=1 Tax=Acorus calamus TaxID=4465 RepID=A0AAV9CCC7_ACOCL|nr:hypothetical protein QJS10_CPB20g00857 [Acorus calamus]